EGQLSIGKAVGAANQDRALGCEQAVVDWHLGVNARDGQSDVALGVAVYGVPTAENAGPICAFTITVEAWWADVTSDRVVDLAASSDQFFSDLTTRRTSANNEHSAFWELLRVAVVDRMDLHN